MKKLTTNLTENVISFLSYGVFYIFSTIAIATTSGKLMWSVTRVLESLTTMNIYVLKFFIYNSFSYLFMLIGLLFSYKWIDNYFNTRIHPITPNQRLIIITIVLTWYIGRLFRYI